MGDILTWRALCALDAIREEAWREPFRRPHMPLRFILGYLHWAGLGCSDSCKEFWERAHGFGWQHPIPNMAENVRRQTLSSAMCAISRSVGHEYTVALSTELKRARMNKSDRQTDRDEEAAYERRKRGDYGAKPSDSND